MQPRKRTRPKSAEGKRPDRLVVIPPLNAPYPGCCVPYPDVTFVDQTITRLVSRHIGPRCGGYTEPIPMEEWNAEVDRRSAARDRSRRDDR